MDITLDDRNDHIPLAVDTEPKVEKGPSLDVWGKDLNKEELSAAYKTSQTSRERFERIQTHIDKLNAEYSSIKDKQDEASLFQMILIAHKVAGLTQHLGAREFKRSMDKLDDDLRELVKSLQATFDNPWGRKLTYISVGVSGIGAVLALAGPIGGVFKMISAGRVSGFAQESITQMLSASQPVGTLGTSFSSWAQMTEKDCEKERQKVQHDQGVAQRTREEYSQARSKAQEKSHEANRNMSELDAARHRATEQV